jgi:hypothetical protein
MLAKVLGILICIYEINALLATSLADSIDIKVSSRSNTTNLIDDGS